MHKPIEAKTKEVPRSGSKATSKLTDAKTVMKVRNLVWGFFNRLER